MPCFKIGSVIAVCGVMAAVAPMAHGQKWEVGGGGGASIYNSQTVSAPAGSVEAKFKTGYGFSGYFGQIGERLGGEVRYTYLSNEMELAGLGKSYSMGGRSQAIHYDLNIYFNSKKSKVRPYVIAGGGMKYYSGTGSAAAVQPLGSIVVLTNTSDWKPMISSGGGVRLAVGRNAHLRAEVRLYMTEVPTKVITPVTGSLSGWYFNIVPMVDLSYVW